MYETEQPEIEAEKCRRLAREADALTMRVLLELARDYEAEARLRAAFPRRHPRRRRIEFP